MQAVDLPPAPAGVHWVAMRYPYTEATLATLGARVPLPERLRDAVVVRRTDFLAGRACALDALRAAGCVAATGIAIGARGAPQWPAGFVGSISHDAGWAIAGAAALRETGALGLDLQQRIARGVCDEVWRQVATGAELRLGAPHMGREDWLTLLFSAKESLFKALHEQVGRHFEFLDVVADAYDPVRGSVRLRLVDALGGGTRRGDGHQVSLHWLGERVLACCAWPAGAAPIPPDAP